MFFCLTLFMDAFYACGARICSFFVLWARLFMIMDFHTCMQISHKPSPLYFMHRNPLKRSTIKTLKWEKSFIHVR